MGEVWYVLYENIRKINYTHEGPCFGQASSLSYFQGSPSDSSCLKVTVKGRWELVLTVSLATAYEKRDPILSFRCL